MYLSITSTTAPARDLGFLLFKHPDRFQSFDLGWGRAHVVYPEASDERCIAALLVEVDPIGLARDVRPGGSGDFALGEYVNDRPYVASSLLAVAIGQVFRSALTGSCAQRPELAETALPLRATIGVVRAGRGEGLLRRLFEPLGYALSCARPLLDDRFPAWGASPYVRLELSGTVRLRDLLRHLYVLLPVVDDQKHYWITEEETQKLLRWGEGWLAHHPARDLILRRYLKHQDDLVAVARAGLPGPDLAPAHPSGAPPRGGEGELDGVAVDEQTDGAVEGALIDTRSQWRDAAEDDAADAIGESEVGESDPLSDAGELDQIGHLGEADLVTDAIEPDADEPPVASPASPPSRRGKGAGWLGPARSGLHQRRIAAVVEVLATASARRVLDLGCGEGKLLLRLRGDDRFAEVVGVDVSLRALEVAKRRLGLAEPPTSPSPTIALKHGSVVYLDRTLVGYDAATLVEVVEHLDPERLPDLERVVFGGLRPGTVVVTTPNADYNVRYDNLAAGRLRHRDHRFEWGRAAFAAWATGVAARNGYAVEVAPIGPRDDEVGAPSQMGVFRRCD